MSDYRVSGTIKFEKRYCALCGAEIGDWHTLISGQTEIYCSVECAGYAADKSRVAQERRELKLN